MAYVDDRINLWKYEQAQSQDTRDKLNNALNTVAGNIKEDRARALATKRANDAQALALSKDGVSADDIAAYQNDGDMSGIQKFYAGANATSRDRAQAKAERDARLAESQITKNLNYRPPGSNQTGPKLTYEQKLDLKNTKEAEAKQKEREDPNFRLEKLGAEGRGKVGAIASGLQALHQMEMASLDGYEPQRIDAGTPILGSFVSDTPYTSANRTLDEVVGRLQSGGAIGKIEGEQFRAMGPRPGDSPEIRKQKIKQQRDFLNNKLAAYGMKDHELPGLGMKIQSDYTPKTKPKTVFQNGHTYTLNEHGEYE
jgi:hypothetical protein